MKKQLLLLLFAITTTISIAQGTATIDTAPTSLGQGEVFTITASFDAGTGDSIDGNLAFVLRLYNTDDNTFSFVANALVDKNGVNAETGIVSPNITVPSAQTASNNLEANMEYRLVVSYKRTVGGNFISTAQAVTITSAVVPTISQSIITTADITVNETGKAIDWTPSPTITISLENFAPNTTYQVFNQFKIIDTNGAQWGGGSINIETDASGNGENTTWNPGFFGADGDFNGTETTGYWNSNVTGPSGAVSTNQTFPITQNATLNKEALLIVNVSLFPNPTTDKITIETQQDFTTVNVYDINGKTVKTFNKEKTLDVRNLNNGMYFLKTNTGLTAKFIKK
ncbi:T9SS type A sorting domain-containing protein [Polaribacter atrinae]|uniref:T9SS type A sorting domain-containing protein n=1 Tax=Polaribacter atrinae TaxID=1333662 RepID=UPI0030FA86D4